MTPYQHQKTSLYEISRELEKVAQFSDLITNSKERQALAKYSWHLANTPSKKPETSKTFECFLKLFINQNSNVRLRLCPSSYSKTSTLQPYSNGAYLLKEAGLDIDSIDTSIQHTLCDFVSALGNYHNQVYFRCDIPLAGTVSSFSSYLKDHKDDIQSSILASEFNEILPSLCNQLAKDYFPDFDLEKISRRSNNSYGNVIYRDLNACEVLNSIQSTLKFDLKSMGVNTSKYHQVKDIASHKATRSKTNNKPGRKNLAKSLGGKLKQKIQDYSFDRS